MSDVLFYEPFYNFDRLLDNALRPFITAEATRQLEQNNAVTPRSFRPRMDLHENSEKNIVSAIFELPGVKKEDIQLEVQDNVLTVSTETKPSVEHEESGYAVRERRFGKFSRSLKLPRGVKDENIKASMADGILTVTFPNNSQEQVPKKISVE